MRTTMFRALLLLLTTALAWGDSLGLGPPPAPTTLPPSGAAGGGLSGTFPNPNLLIALDNTFSIGNQSDSTKAIGFALGGATTGTQLTLASSQTASRTLTVPVLVAADTMMTLGTAQTVTGVKTLELPVIADATDSTKAIGFVLSGATTGTTLTLSSSQTASRTLTIPVLAGTDTVATLAIANAFTGNNTSSGTFQVTNTTTTSSGSTGSLINAGGFGNNGNIYDNGTLTVGSTCFLSGLVTGAAGFKTNGQTLMQCGNASGFTNNAGSSAGTLTNAPAIGNPTKWIPVNDNGTTRNIPAW